MARDVDPDGSYLIQTRRDSRLRSSPVEQPQQPVSTLVESIRGPHQAQRRAPEEMCARGEACDAVRREELRFVAVPEQPDVRADGYPDPGGERVSGAI